MSAVTITNVAKSFGSQKVLHAVSLSIGDGEFTVLVGPSGCGKSTLLRIIAGLESADGGEIEIGGKDVSDVAPKDRDIAMVFQNYALYPHMTVADNLGFALKMRGLSRPDIAGRVERAAQTLGLSNLLARYPRQLSGGQRQRVAMGRAIVRDPKVFLFDEPLSNLDARLRIQMRAEIKEVHQRLRTTTVYVTHDQVEAMTLADRIVVMHDGRIEQTGAPLEIYDRPVSTFVAGFIGSPAMNFIPGEISGSEAMTFTIGNGLTLPLPDTDPSLAGRAAILGLRPEHISVAEQGLPADVVVIEPTGAETHVVARLGTQTIVCAFRERLSLREGETIRIGARPGAIHLFDAATARRLHCTGNSA